MFIFRWLKWIFLDLTAILSPSLSFSLLTHAHKICAHTHTNIHKLCIHIDTHCKWILKENLAHKYCKLAFCIFNEEQSFTVKSLALHSLGGSHVVFQLLGIIDYSYEHTRTTFPFSLGTFTVSNGSLAFSSCKNRNKIQLDITSD